MQRDVELGGLVHILVLLCSTWHGRSVWCISFLGAPPLVAEMRTARLIQYTQYFARGVIMGFDHEEEELLFSTDLCAKMLLM